MTIIISILLLCYVCDLCHKYSKIYSVRSTPDKAATIIFCCIETIMLQDLQCFKYRPGPLKSLTIHLKQYMRDVQYIIFIFS